MERTFSVSVVIPVYNSAATLPALLERLVPVVASHATRAEIILVNDGSRDQSWEVVCSLAERYPEVRGINLLRNYGQHNALLCGIRTARNQVIVTMDDDLQNPPEEIPKLLGKLSKGYDVVYGTPDQRQHGLGRNMASYVLHLALGRAMGTDVARNASAFRAFRTQVRDGFADYRGPNVAIDVLLTWGTSRFASVPVRHEPRQVGTSNYSLRKLMTLAINLITGFSTLPLQLASWVGFGFTIFGVGVLAYVVGRYLIKGGSVPGFPFLASTMAIFSGGQLFALGIIGEYLARMHFRMMDRPAYVIRQTRGWEREGEHLASAASVQAAVEPTPSPLAERIAPDAVPTAVLGSS